MELREHFAAAFGSAPQFVVHAPGRINLLGEHVDYNDGAVLPAAIDRAVHLAVAPQPGGLVTLSALDLGKQASFELEALDEPGSPKGRRLPNWVKYPAGVAWALRQAGLAVGGMKAAYTSDVPIGAGLSSSAAVEVAFAAAWRELGGWQVDNLQLARLCQLGAHGKAET